MVSEVIKKAMSERNVTGRDLAKSLNCSSQTVYANLLRDDWRLKNLKKYANALDCDLQVVLKDRKSKKTFKCDVTE